jgi:aspartate aminotransferase
VLSDEIYERLVYGDARATCFAALRPELPERTITVSGASKTYAMTGWRMGFVLGPAAVVAGINKLQSHTTSNPTSITQKAAIEALRGPQESVSIMLAEYRRRRDYVIGRLRKMPGVKAQEPRGAFYAYPNVSAAFRNGISSSLEFSEKLLAEEHVAVVPGEAFGTADHIRLSYATSMKELEKGLDRLERFIKARV